MDLGARTHYAMLTWEHHTEVIPKATISWHLHHVSPTCGPREMSPICVSNNLAPAVLKKTTSFVVSNARHPNCFWELYDNISLHGYRRLLTFWGDCFSFIYPLCCIIIIFSRCWIKSYAVILKWFLYVHTCSWYFLLEVFGEGITTIDYVNSQDTSCIFTVHWKSHWKPEKQ